MVHGHVVAAIGLLRKRLEQPWTLNALADEVHLSRSQLVRAFDAVTGTSPMAYLRQMRVERMARLLASTDLSIGEIARSVGWRHQFTLVSASMPLMESRLPNTVGANRAVDRRVPSDEHARSAAAMGPGELENL